MTWTPETIAERYAPDLPRLIYGIPFLKRFAVKYTDDDDALGWAAVGLMAGAHKYDPSRGTKPLTYLAWWIWRYLQIGLRYHSVDLEGCGWHGHDAAKRPMVLPESCYRLTDDESLLEAASTDDEQPECDAAEMVRKALAPVNETRRRALVLHIADGLTLREVGEIMGISKERARHHVDAGLASAQRERSRKRLCRWCRGLTANLGRVCVRCLEKVA